MPKDIKDNDLQDQSADEMSIEEQSYRDWTELNASGKPTKQQIEAFDARFGPTRRGILKETLQRKQKQFRPWSW